VHEALRTVRIGRRSAGEDLDKAVARDVQVDEHEGAVVVVEAEGLLDAEQGVELERSPHVARGEGGVPYVFDHFSVLRRLSGRGRFEIRPYGLGVVGRPCQVRSPWSRRVMSAAKRTSESSSGS
jgi:hypothetical protein